VSVHSHDQAPSGRLRLALMLTVGILAIELVAGWAAHSLALLADAGHILTDVFALGLAWFAVVQARRPADSERTYGYHRAGILAAAVNSLTLIVIVAAIVYEAVQRLRHPEPVNGLLVASAALVAITINTFIGLQLRGAGNDLNVRAAMLHVLSDLGASAGVVAAGLVILLTGWSYADPLISLAISAIIAFMAVRIVRSAVNVLLEGAPAGIDVDQVRQVIGAVPGVDSVHDLHVWALGSREIALSCHVVVGPQELAAAERTVREIESRVCERFGIGHTTVQLESREPCPEEIGHGPGQHNHPHPAGLG
jgi:cobalt-zinc-cadmium efflux system protein